MPDSDCLTARQPAPATLSRACLSGPRHGLTPHSNESRLPAAGATRAEPGLDLEAPAPPG